MHKHQPLQRDIFHVIWNLSFPMVTEGRLSQSEIIVLTDLTIEHIRALVTMGFENMRLELYLKMS